ncbi:hypothetical protein BJX99DRAFT_259332 [Aspergillus californicus]
MVNKEGYEAATVALLVVPALALVPRCYVRLWVVKAFGWDDALMVLTMALNAGCGGVVLQTIKIGVGESVLLLSTPHRVALLKYWWIGQLLYLLAAPTCRTSVCIYLLRVAIKPAHSRTLYVVILVTVLNGLGGILILMLICRPIEHFWTRADFGNVDEFDAIPVGSCLPAPQAIIIPYVYSAISAACDLAVGTLPIFMIYRLQMAKITKWVVACILSLAAIASAAILLRLAYGNLHNQLNLPFPLLILSMAEVSLGTTAGSLATLGPLFRGTFGTPANSANTDATPDGPAPRQPRRQRRFSNWYHLSDSSGSQSLPLSTLASTITSRLHPDKPAAIVTGVRADHQHSSQRREVETGNESREQLTFQNPRGATPESSREARHLSIFRDCDHAQTSDVDSMKEVRCV